MKGTYLIAIGVGMLIGTCLTHCVRADEIPPSAAPAHICNPEADWRAQAEKAGAKIEALRGAQFEFLRGVAVMSPLTPPGLPYGDRAALVSAHGENSVVFMDDDFVCDPMPAPKELIDMLRDVGNGVVKHQGDGT